MPAGTGYSSGSTAHIYQGALGSLSLDPTVNDGNTATGPDQGPTSPPAQMTVIIDLGSDLAITQIDLATGWIYNLGRILEWASDAAPTTWHTISTGPALGHSGAFSVVSESLTGLTITARYIRYSVSDDGDFFTTSGRVSIREVDVSANALTLPFGNFYGLGYQAATPNDASRYYGPGGGVTNSGSGSASVTVTVDQNVATTVSSIVGVIGYANTWSGDWESSNDGISWSPVSTTPLLSTPSNGGVFGWVAQTWSFSAPVTAQFFRLSSTDTGAIGQISVAGIYPDSNWTDQVTTAANVNPNATTGTGPSIGCQGDDHCTYDVQATGGGGGLSGAFYQQGIGHHGYTGCTWNFATVTLSWPSGNYYNCIDWSLNVTNTGPNPVYFLFTELPIFGDQDTWQGSLPVNANTPVIGAGSSAIFSGTHLIDAHHVPADYSVLGPSQTWYCYAISVNFQTVWPTPDPLNYAVSVNGITGTAHRSVDGDTSGSAVSVGSGAGYGTPPTPDAIVGAQPYRVSSVPSGWDDGAGGAAQWVILDNTNTVIYKAPGILGTDLIDVTGGDCDFISVKAKCDSSAALPGAVINGPWTCYWYIESQLGRPFPYEYVLYSKSRPINVISDVKCSAPIPTDIPENHIRLAADAARNVLNVGWVSGGWPGALKTAVHLGPQSQIGSGDQGWETTQTLEASAVSGLGMSYLANDLLFLCYSLSGSAKYRTNDRFGLTGGWSSATSGGAAEYAQGGRGQLQAWRITGGNALGFSQCRDNRGQSWTGATAITGAAKLPLAGGAWMRTDYGVLYTRASDNKVIFSRSADLQHWSSLDTGLTGTVYSLTRHPAGWLLGLIKSGSDWFPIWSHDRGATWTAGSAISISPDLGPALVTIGNVVYCVYIVSDAPAFVASQDRGVTWS